MKQDWHLRLLLCLAALGIIVLSSSRAPAESIRANAIVAITDNFRFDPDTVTIHAGETVEWRNQSHFRHTVTDDPRMTAQPGDAALPAGAEPFSSQQIPPGGSYSRMLSVPGTYRYFCMPHEGIGMLGKVVVLPAD